MTIENHELRGSAIGTDRYRKTGKLYYGVGLVFFFGSFNAISSIQNKLMIIST